MDPRRPAAHRVARSGASSVALPSLIQHFLLPNARHGCDVFLKTHAETEAEAAADAAGLAALRDAAAALAAHAGRPSPAVVLLPAETEGEFESKYGDLVARHCTASDPGTGKPLYFPWADRARALCADLRDVIQDWDAVQATWDALVKRGEEQGGTGYGRVGLLRLDAFYARPLDVFQLDKDSYDYATRYAVIPGFDKCPVNDRLVYGPAAAVKIWAAKRFQRF